MLQKIINWLNDLRPRQLLILAAVAGFLMFLTIFFAMKLVSKKEVVVPPPVVEKAPEPAPEPQIEKKTVVVAKVNKIVYRIMDDLIEIADFWDVRREPQALADEVK